MKGPGNRVKFVIRRSWECPRCGMRLVTSGSVVHINCPAVACVAAAAQFCMRLVKDPLRTSRKDVPP
jgi:hypothetical protein